MKIFLLVLAVMLAGCTIAEENTGTVTINNLEFKVELPQTPAEFQQGLMFRESLDDDKGMLFVYSDSAPRSFWMKNTLIPLDIISIDENFVIKKIHYAVPCKEDSCLTYNSGAPVKYVLELRGNLTIENNIKEGDVALIK
tara:strand:- start:36439 stop:36858 length:420 start_codon:yes stop_codon:yes gene_type:complete